MLDSLLQKGFDEDTRFGKILREGAALVKGIRTPAVSVTTSEPRVGNGPPGAPVTASMSGSAVQGNQGGTVEYFVSHP